MAITRDGKKKETLDDLIAALIEAGPSLKDLKPEIVNCLIQIKYIKEWRLNLSLDCGAFLICGVIVDC